MLSQHRCLRIHQGRPRRHSITPGCSGASRRPAAQIAPYTSLMMDDAKHSRIPGAFISALAAAADLKDRPIHTARSAKVGRRQPLKCSPREGGTGRSSMYGYCHRCSTHLFREAEGRPALGARRRIEFVGAVLALATAKTFAPSRVLSVQGHDRRERWRGVLGRWRRRLGLVWWLVLRILLLPYLIPACDHHRGVRRSTVWKTSSDHEK
ncbi:hypothetical protein BC628DRAFT_1387801 [Trametes gibbosa]|nr:hypothetical protein BC628DRAFT_1387801 [Trametes gibbosa]